jgi:hypothetical protein
MASLPRLLEREVFLDALGTARGVVFVGGEAGVGKTVSPSRRTPATGF